jgi:hypothetical protein
VEEAQRGGVASLAVSGPRIPQSEERRLRGTEQAPA